MNVPKQIVYIDFGEAHAGEGSSGIERKKQAQIKELGKLGEVRRLTFSPKKKRGFFGNFSRMLPFSPSMFFIQIDEESLKNIDIVYFRKPAYIDRYTIKLLKLIRKLNPKCLILFELPTYPYDKEKRGAVKYPLLLKDRWNRKKLHRYVNRIVLVVSTEPVVFEVPTITIFNGIDFSKIQQREIIDTGDDIHAVIVGNFEFWHGLDRLIDGMKEYYRNTANTRKFILHVVGPTERVIDAGDREIIDLVNQGVLYLYGKLPLHEVEVVYDKVSLAFSSLGIHRIGINSVNSSVKSREYSAKGLPIISDSKIDFIPDGYKYFLKIPADNSAIRIQGIITFHDAVYSKQSSIIATEIRTFAQAHCSSSAMMKPVLEYCRTSAIQ